MQKLTQSKLTIILQYKNRFDFVCRWLKFAYSQSCPFEIIVADGSKSETLKKYIEKNNFSSRIKIRHIKTQYDKTFNIYCKKVINALQSVKTSYVLLADDDDFYNFKNLQKCVSKLESDKKIVTCGGQISHFKILDGEVKGKKVSFNLSFKENFCNTSVMKNIEQYLLQPKGIYYFIHRLQDYKKAWLICKRHNLSPRMIELFVELYLFTRGRVEILPITFYYRQYDHSVNNTANMTNDFLDEIIKFNWHKEINIILDVISKIIAKREKNDYKVIKENLILYYKNFLTPFVINNLKVEGSSNLAILARNNMLKKGLKAGKLKIYYKFFRIIKSYINYFFYKRKNNISETEFLIKFLRNYKN